MLARIALRLAVVTAIVLVLSACGGGGGDSPTPEAPPPAPAPDPVAQPDPAPDPDAQAALRAGEEIAKAAANEALPLPADHGLEPASLEIASRAWVDRNGFRFSCTGSEACVVAIDPDTGQARVTAGEVRLARLEPAPAPAPPAPDPEPAPPVARPAPAPDPEPQGAPVALPQGHSVPAGSFDVAAGETVERGGVRFSCAAGGAACRIVVADGQARSTGGTLTAARIATAMPGPRTPVQPTPAPEPVAQRIPWPAWAIMDIARAQAVLGGPLNWGVDRVRQEMHRRLDDWGTRSGPRYQFGIDGNGNIIGTDDNSYTSEVAIRTVYDANGDFASERVSDYRDYSATSLSGTGSLAYELHNCSFSNGIDECPLDQVLQYQAVGMHNTGIPVIQARYVEKDDGEDYLTIFGGVLDYMDFWVVERKKGKYSDHDFSYHSAYYRLLNDNIDQENRIIEMPVRGTWHGLMLGVGHNKAYPDLFNQRIAGDVSITTDFEIQSEEGATLSGASPGDPNRLDVDVQFSNVKNLNTGATVSLSKTRWEIRSTGQVASYSWPKHSFGALTSLRYPPYSGSRPIHREINVEFGGDTGYTVAAGVFALPDAIGAFGARKQ